VTLNASNLINQGVLASLNANVNIAAMTSNLQNVININNTMGTIRALNGAVNIGNAGLSKSAILSLLGGTIAAPQINLNGGAGTIRAMLDSMNGLVNVSAGVADVGTRSGNLNLGTLNVTGDPTYFNDGGDITITNDIFAQDNLAILAK